METLQQIAIALIPSIGIGFLFYKVVKAIVESDRNERLAYSRWQAEHDAEDGRRGPSPNGSDGEIHSEVGRE